MIMTDNDTSSLMQVKLAKFEKIIEDVGSHCLHHNELTDSLTQIASDLSQIDTDAVDGSEDASTLIEVGLILHHNTVSKVWIEQKQ